LIKKDKVAGGSSLEKENDESTSLASLGIAIGTIFTIETISPVRKYPVHLLGYSEHRSIFISSPLREGKEVLLDKDCTLTVRLLIGKTVCAFQTKVLYRSIQPYTYYHLAYPVEIEALQVRNSERVDTKIEADIDSDFDIVGEWPKPALINNLSKTGAKMTSPYSLGDKGHELLVTLQLSVSGMDKRVCLPSLIRNIEVNAGVEVGHEGRYVVGVEFVNLTDEQRLTLSTYIYEHNR